MTLKIATEEDFITIADMTRKFYEHTPYYGVVDYDESKIADVVLGLFGNPTERIAILALDDNGQPVGMLCGQVGETLFNRNRVALELGWWMDPDHRASRLSIELIEAFEYWAKTIANCTYVQLSTVETRQAERIGRFYKRKGYDLYERGYLKVIR